MLLEKIAPLLEPTDMIAVAGPGMKGVFYIGQAVNLPERKDLMAKEVLRIGRELVYGHNRICIKINPKGGAA